MACLFLSCQKDKVDPNTSTNLRESILLEISPDQNSYIGATGNHYYTHIFTHKNDTNLYELKIKKGVKYHMICVQPDLVSTNIKMELKNSKGKLLYYSVNFEGKTEMVFAPDTDENLYLWVTLNNGTSESLKYNLYFEESNPADFNFMNLNWGASGNWKAINSQTLEFTCSDTREFRWIRLNSTIPDNVDLSFTMKSITKTELPSFGFVLDGSQELKDGGVYTEELPMLGYFYNIIDMGTYKITRFSTTTETHEDGTMNIPNIDINSGININTGRSGTTINNVLLWKGINLASKDVFYLVIEDKGFDKITFENIKLN